MVFNNRVIGSVDVGVTMQEEIFICFRVVFQNLLEQTREIDQNPKF
jgi:hypothetical protein